MLIRGGNSERQISAGRKGYYPKIIDFMQGFLGSVFKTNDYLEFGVQTGVRRISIVYVQRMCGFILLHMNPTYWLSEVFVKIRSWAIINKQQNQKNNNAKARADNALAFAGNKTHNTQSI